jgi:hypothetical protein
MQAGSNRTAIVQCHPIDHSQSIATVPSDPTSQCDRTATVLGGTIAQRHAAHGRDVA